MQRTKQAKARRCKRVIIAGGGIAGLSCAYELKKRGHDVTLLEASDRVGGHVRTIRMTDALAARLGECVRLNSPVTGIAHGASGVTVTYRHADGAQKISADYLVTCMPLTQLRHIPVRPAWPRAKAHVIRHTGYTQQSRVVFQTRTPFWKRGGGSGNLRLEGDVFWTCPVAEEVGGPHGLLMATGHDAITAEQAIAALHKGFPGSKGQIEQALVKVWVTDRWAPSCERLPFPLGKMPAFWPEIMRPHGRIHFAGAYADNLIWGMEAATRSAHRAAVAIDGEQP